MKRITIRHGATVILSTKGTDIDVQNWMNVFHTVEKTTLDGEVVLAVAPAPESN